MGKALLTKRFERALSYVVRLHGKQLRKGTEIPYMSHLLGVASLVMEHGGNEDEIIAALLHDSIEDQGGEKTRNEIQKRFGEKVVGIVNGCTDSDVVPKPPWRKRKEAYIAHLKHAPYSVRLVSAADKLHNARAILNDCRELGESLWNRFNASRDEILWYYRSLVNAFREHGSTPLIEELDRVVSEIEELAVEKQSKPEVQA